MSPTSYRTAPPRVNVGAVLSALERVRKSRLGAAFAPGNPRYHAAMSALTDMKRFGLGCSSDTRSRRLCSPFGPVSSPRLATTARWPFVELGVVAIFMSSSWLDVLLVLERDHGEVRVNFVADEVDDFFGRGELEGLERAARGDFAFGHLLGLVVGHGGGEDPGGEAPPSPSRLEHGVAVLVESSGSASCTRRIRRWLEPGLSEDEMRTSAPLGV